MTFFRGTSLTPIPPIESKTPETRYLHISENKPLDEVLFIDWVKQASQLPGEHL